MNETGRIVKGVGGLYTVLFSNEKVLHMSAKGVFRNDGVTPLPGDFAECEIPENQSENGVICRIEKRKNELVRPACANVDRLIIVACSEHPKVDLYMLDKLSAVAVKNGIEVVFVFNKDDSDDVSHLTECYGKAGFRTFAVSVHESAKYSAEFIELKSLMYGGVNIFAGASGVGKSSIIGFLFPNFAPQTGELSRKISRGKHTTRATELFYTGCDTFIADTPGFSMLDTASERMIDKDELISCFPDIEKFSHGCRYRDCSHTKEGVTDCSVIQALSNGNISASRHESYVKLKNELEGLNDWENK